MQQYFYLLIAFAIWTLVMNVASSGPKTMGKGDINKPGLAMEFASSAPDVQNAFTLRPESIPRTSEEELKRQVIRQQYLDFVFIGLYWAVFFFVIGRPLMQSPAAAAWICGLLVCICISVAAIADVFEDVAILHVIGGGRQFWPLWFGAPKWAAYFLAVGFSAALFFLRPVAIFTTTETAWFHCVVLASGFLSLAGSIAGLFGLSMFLRSCKGGGAIALGLLFSAVPMLVLLFQCFRNFRAAPAAGS